MPPPAASTVADIQLRTPVPSSTEQGGRLRRLVRRLWVPAVLIIAALTSTGLSVAAHPQAFSPMDEYVYYDYLLKVPSQPFVRQGEVLDLRTRDRLSCDGVIAFGGQGPACDGDHSRPERYVFEGKTSASGYTPLFFWLTSAAAAPLRWAGIGDLTAYRLTGGLWLAGALLALYLLLRRFKVPSPVILGLGFVVIAAPYSWLSYTFVSTDATVLLFGALMLLTALKVVSREWPAWVFPALAVLAATLKVTNLIPVLLGALVLVFVALGQSRFAVESRSGADVSRPRLRAVLSAGAGLVLFCVVQRVWMAVQAALAVAPPPDQFVPSADLSPDLLATLALRMVVEPINQSIVAPDAPIEFLYPMPTAMTLGLSALCAVGIGAPLLQRVGSAALLALRWPIAVGVLAGPVVMAVAMQVVNRYFDLPPRYGAGAIPAIFLLLALSARNRPIQWLLFAFGVALLAWNLSYRAG